MLPFGVKCREIMGIRTSWRAVVQVVAFRNIDVCTAGVYRVEIGVTSEDQRSRDLIKASASNLTKSSFFRSFLPSNITANAYISAPFQISYSDEVIPIGDIVDFEIDIEITASTIRLTSSVISPGINLR